MYNEISVKKSFIEHGDKEMIKVGIIGATGYAGAEIARLIYSHPEAEIVWYGSRSYIDDSFASI